MGEVGSRTRVAVVFGGRSGEHEVSCRSAVSVLRHLDRDRYDVLPIRISRDGVWVLGRENPETDGLDVLRLLDLTWEHPDLPGRLVTDSIADAVDALHGVDVVFPCLHGPYGEDGTIQALLDLADVPYVGSGVLASATAMDKEFTKKMLAAGGIAVADGVVLRGQEPTAAADRLGLPVFVKPARAGSSLGVSRVDDWADLDDAVALARRADDKVLVEAAVGGREVDVAVLEFPDGRLAAGPALEITVPDGRRFFDYDAKYGDAGTTFTIPAALPAEVAGELADLAVRAFEALGCAGLLRVDFFLRPDGDRLVPVVNEVNTIPGLTSAPQYPQIWRAAGVDYPELLDVLIATAVARGSAGERAVRRQFPDAPPAQRGPADQERLLDRPAVAG
jgi:D-alanine-D-alanine ligase